MRIKALTIVLTAAAITLAFASTGRAQDRYERRYDRQHDRIHSGFRNGEVTRHEGRALRREQARIRHARDYAEADGWVSPRERHQINRMQNRASRNIYHHRHDDYYRHHHYAPYRAYRHDRYEPNCSYRYNDCDRNVLLFGFLPPPPPFLWPFFDAGR